MMVGGNLAHFPTLLKRFLAAGGEIRLNKKWCDEFGVQRCDIPGVQIISSDEVAHLLADAEKITDYATPDVLP